MYADKDYAIPTTDIGIIDIETKERISVALTQHKTQSSKLSLILVAVLALVGLLTPYGSSVFAAPGDYAYSYSVGTRVTI